MSLEALIIQYGYLALFIGTFLEGETILIIAGYLAQDGVLDLRLVTLAAFLGSFSGDQFFFFLGRYKGIGFLAKRPHWQQKTQKAFALLSRHQIPIILGFRFIYGIRNVTPFVIGSMGLRPIRFFILNGLGAATWAIAFASFGYHLGRFVEVVLPDIARYEMLVLAVLCIILLVLGIFAKGWKQ
jgi:membrane protein DedA with SNARE-associated domain